MFIYKIKTFDIWHAATLKNPPFAKIYKLKYPWVITDPIPFPFRITLENRLREQKVLKKNMYIIKGLSFIALDKNIHILALSDIPVS